MDYNSRNIPLLREKSNRANKCYKKFLTIAGPLLQNSRVQMLNEYVQHGNTTRLLHSIGVAYYSLVFADFLHLKCDEKSMIWGALLHDYFLYDWHDKGTPHYMHGFRHPEIAMNNAIDDFDINHLEKDIIKKHMFPLTLRPPRYRESMMVSLLDKVCSVYETFSANPYPAFDKKRLLGIEECE